MAHRLLLVPIGWLSGLSGRAVLAIGAAFGLQTCASTLISAQVILMAQVFHATRYVLRPPATSLGEVQERHWWATKLIKPVDASPALRGKGKGDSAGGAAVPTAGRLFKALAWEILFAQCGKRVSAAPVPPPPPHFLPSACTVAYTHRPPGRAHTPGRRWSTAADVSSVR